MGQDAEPAALGFRVHASWATAAGVVLRSGAPDVLRRRRVELWQPGVPESKGPYHAALEVDDREGARLIRQGTRAARSAAGRALRTLASEVRALGHVPLAVGLVVASDPDPSRVHNPHMHAHAAESVLYREALADGAKELGLPSVFFIEADLLARASQVLRLPSPGIEATLKALGKRLGPPWRAEERGATLAAWIALHTTR
jgi:hypothetical protein